jgi:lipoprotein-releasing system permease protein
MTQLEFTGDPLKKEGALAAVMLSSTIAQKLGVEVGQRVAFMVVPDSSSSVVRPVLANVTALYDSGYHELDSSLLFMNRDDALRYFPKDRNAYTELLVSREHVDELGEVVAALESSLDMNFPYATWDEFNGTVYQNFITSRQVILLVFMMILLVAGVYVSSIAQEMIQDSMQSIALFKTLGATNRNLSWAYFSSVMVVTSIGLLAGVSLGLLIGSQIGVLLHWLGNSGLAGLQYYLLDFPIVISWRDLLAISFSMLVISSVTVRLSLGRIKRISPLEMLQQD